MKEGTSSDRIIARLAEMPFIDRLELSSLTGLPESTVSQAASRLMEAGLITAVPHRPEHGSHTKRFSLTAEGIHQLAKSEEKSVDDIIRSHPISAQWRHLLLPRLDALAVVYSVIETISGVATPISVRLYRSHPLDAVVTLPDGRTIGISRQGRTTDKSSFGKRLQRLFQGPLPGSLLFIVQDEIRLRHTRRTLSPMRAPVFIGLEKDAVTAFVNDTVWQRPGNGARFDMDSIVEKSANAGGMPAERIASRASLPVGVPTGTALSETPPHLLPSALQPADKRVLDMLADWPGISPQNLRLLLGLSPARISQVLSRLNAAELVLEIDLKGRRLVPTDRALALIARRDRTSVGVAQRRWSMGSIALGTPVDWRDVPGRRLRQLLRHIEHTDAVHTYLASTVSAASKSGWEVVQLDPPHRASRYFRYENGQRSVHPDAFFMLRRGDETKAYFLEWERRAVRPSTMRERLAPYLRYYSTKRPLDDHGVAPTVLIVVEDKVIVPHFGRIAGEEMVRSGVRIPLSVR